MTSRNPVTGNTKRLPVLLKNGFNTPNIIVCIHGNSHAVAHSYCCAWFGFLPYVDGKMTVRLSNNMHAAARVVMNQHTRTSQLSSSELLKQLNWLPIEWRIRFKLATLTFKALRTGYPPYLSNLLQHHEPVRSLRLSSLIIFQFPVTI